MLPYHDRPSGTFDPDDLRLFARVYDDVCRRLEEEGAIALTTKVQETIAISILDAASKGERCCERLWCRAMRSVEANNGVGRSQAKIKTHRA